MKALCWTQLHYSFTAGVVNFCTKYFRLSHAKSLKKGHDI